MDYTNTFDSVEQQQLWTVMREMGFPKRIVSLIEAFTVNNNLQSEQKAEQQTGLRWVYTFDAVKRFDTLSYASQMRRKTFCGVSVCTFHAGISARQRARESVARRKMLQSSTVLNFHALRQRTQAIQPVIYRCHELSLQRIDLAITSESSHWTISSGVGIVKRT